jgi:adenylate cyclase
VSSSSTTAERGSLRWIAGLAAAAWLAVHSGLALWPELFQAWDWKAIDRFFVLRSRLECPSPPCRGGVVHVDVTYSALQRMPGRQLSRADHARVIQNLVAGGTRAQAFDMVFAAPGDPDENAALAHAADASARAYFAVAFHPEPRSSEDAAEPADDAHVVAASWDAAIDGDVNDLAEGFAPLATIPELAAAAGIGFINLTADSDGVFRRTPLVMRYKGRVFPSLGLRVACDLLGVAPRDVVIAPGRAIRLRNARPLEGGDARDIVIPIDRAGRYRVDFAGPWEAFRHVSYREVWRATYDPLALEDLKQALAGQVAVVADVSTGAGDGGPVPTDHRYLLPGVHATVIQNILHASFVREARAAEMIAIELLLLAAVTTASWRLRAARIAIGAVVLGALYVGVALAVFLYLRVILQVVGPLLALGGAAFATVAYRFVNEEKARAVLKQSFEAYFPPAVVDRIVKNPGLVTASGQKKELSILFSDIVGFTSRCEGMAPDEIRQFLNEHFAAMVEVAFAHGGTVDKFIGDGLMVFFGDPEDQPDHAVRAVRCAIEMQRKAREISAARERAGGAGYLLRIGINTGVVTVGNMGSPRRLSYTVLGSPVNLAQRLESNAPRGGILVSSRTAELVAGAIATVPKGAVPLKGVDQPVPVYEVPIVTS